jgi:putative acetyltransferase
MIRDATEADIAALAAVAVRSYRAGFAHILDEAELARADEVHFRRRFARDWPLTRLAEDEGAVLGFCTQSQGHVHMLFVDPVGIGSGIGRDLLGDAERAGACTLECFADNRRAIAFYERCGWRIEKRYEREFLGRSMHFVAMAKAGEARRQRVPI